MNRTQACRKALGIMYRINRELTDMEKRLERRSQQDQKKAA